MARGPVPRSSRVAVRLARLKHAHGLDLPRYQTAGAAGLDLAAAVPSDRPMRLEPMQRALVPTGLVLALPAGYEAQVRPRSGLALRHGITVLNSPGTIDSDYRGEVQVLLVNLGEKPWEIERGERIAQLVVARIEQVEIVAVDVLDATGRGAGGFGSTGTSPKPRRAGLKKSKSSSPGGKSGKSKARVVR